MINKRKTVGIPAIAVLMLLIPAGVFAYDVGKVSIHGFVSQGYLKSNANNYLAKTEKGTFEFNETAVNFSVEPSENLRVGLQLMSRDLGNSGDNDIYLDWGYADYRFADAFGIRVGKVKIPHGFYNQTRDVDFLRTSILLPQGIYDETFREIVTAFQGGGIYGDIDAGPIGDMEYEMIVGTLNMDTSTPLLADSFADLSIFAGGGQAFNKDADIDSSFEMMLADLFV